MKIFFLSGFIAFIFSGACAQVSVATQHNNVGRTGWNNRETILHTKNVKKQQFGMIFARLVDDQIYAEPLVVSNVLINGTNRNVVFVATVNNSLYAFDADSASLLTPYWQRNLTSIGARVINKTDMCGGFYNDFSGNMGIVGTPVVDTVTQTLYVVARDVSGPAFHQYLHAIDIRTGEEKPGSPAAITAQVNGNGNGSSGGVIRFDAKLQNQRSGLLLLNNTVYIAYASHGDCGDYHGWLLGYDGLTLAQTRVYNNTPEGHQAGIWMSGAGPSADEFGNIYLASGNGSVGTPANPNDLINRGESSVKLTPSGSSFTVASFFTPFNFDALESSDLDFGVTAVMLIPNSNWAVAGTKDGYLFLMDRDNMGGFNTGSNNVLQTIDLGRGSYMLSALSYYVGSSQEYMYSWSVNDPLTAFPFNRISNRFDLPNLTTSSAVGPQGYNGALLSVSSNGSVDSTAILWTSHAASGNANQETRPGIIRAFNANDVTQELWNSSMDPHDNPGNYAKFVCPMIANGKVYMATFSNKLVVYGLVNRLITEVGSNRKEGWPRVYPNPAPEQLIIGKGAAEIVEINFYDLSGKLLKTITNTTGSPEINLPVSEYAKGLYLLQVKTADKTYRFKVIH